MCGLSAGFLFAVVNRLIEPEDPGLTERHPGAPAYPSGSADRIQTRKASIRGGIAGQPRQH